MRNAFASEITRLADDIPELVLLAGDIGNRLFDKFKEKYPLRFYNCGVAEAGMTGFAAGLASSGLLPVTYTITPFNTLRCLEQIRVDICYPNLPVIIVGTGAGLSYSSLGATHHSMEDIAIMRVLPNMQVICPGDAIEVKLAVEQALKIRKPTYIRIGKKGEPLVHNVPPLFEIGKGINVREGSDIAILGVGNMLASAMETAELLSNNNISAKVVSFHTVKPLDIGLLANIFTSYKLIAVMEEHALTGGVTSAILEWACINRMDTRKLCSFSGPDSFLSGCGDQDEARDSIGLTPSLMCQKLMDHYVLI
jgi:transketolase